MMSSAESSQIRQIMQSPQWPIVEKVARELCVTIHEEPLIREDQWSTLSNALLNEGQVRGIHRLLQELFRLASHEQRRVGSTTAKTATWSDSDTVVG